MHGRSFEGIQHVRAVQPLRFPESQAEWDLGHSIRHLELCAILYELLGRAVDRTLASVGSDQFVYWDANDPRKCLAPDAFVTVGVAQTAFDTWKVWERGAPELAIEVLSPSDTREPFSFETKLERYASLGVLELVAFDIDAPVGRRLRAWDRVEGDLVERVIDREETPCLTLGVTFAIAAADDRPIALRLSRAGALVLTEREEKDRALDEIARLRAATRAK